MPNNENDVDQSLSHDHHLSLRQVELSDYKSIAAIMDRVYATWGGAWDYSQFQTMLRIFPEGQVCIVDNDVVVAAAFSVIVDYDQYGDKHTYDQITGNAHLTTHNPKGDVLYGVDVFVDPDYRDMRLGRRLYEARKEMCRNLNLRAIVAGGRIPGYNKHAEEMSPHQYIEKVSKKELYDPILTFQLSNDFKVKRLLRNYLPEDKASGGFATLLQWNNIYYEEESQDIFLQRNKNVRVGIVQWKMRTTKDIEDLMRDVEFFVDALSDYKSDFVLFPEFFNAPLLAHCDQRNLVEAIHQLATYTDDIIEQMSSLAVRYNTNIITGSLPFVEDGKLYNISYLCHRSGAIEYQSKIHITPNEAKTWVMQGGNSLKVFETDVCKIGILICYDVEFPELSRLLAQDGMDILFVPYWTDTKNGYLRVRHCAQARAIENECYVAISGSVGNLPKVENAELQYGQSAIFSPSDFAFPHDAIMAETIANTEMTLICDLDLSKLEHMRKAGAVTNTKDRRTDLYTLKWND